jgi:hypothetical protein
VAQSLLRGDVSVDVIALVSMGGTLILGEYLAGAVIALMLSGGKFIARRFRSDPRDGQPPLPLLARGVGCGAPRYGKDGKSRAYPSR